MSAQMLSLCCGALPLHGVVNERFGHRTGHCGACKGHTTFVPRGTLDGQPRYVLPALPATCQLSRIDRHAARGGWVAWLCLVGTGLALLLLFWGSWRRGQVERGERSTQGVVEQGLGGAHGGPSLPETTPDGKPALVEVRNAGRILRRQLSDGQWELCCDGEGKGYFFGGKPLDMPSR